LIFVTILYFGSGCLGGQGQDLQVEGATSLFPYSGAAVAPFFHVSPLDTSISYRIHRP
jgi:hypothetical protein